MDHMFSSAKTFNKPLDKWKVHNVISMNNMFNDAQCFNQNLENWNTEKVINMDAMFKNSSFDISNTQNWNIERVNFILKMYYHNKPFEKYLTTSNYGENKNEPELYKLAEHSNLPIEEWDIPSYVSDY